MSRPPQEKPIEEWRNAPIVGAHPYVYLDGMAMKRNWTGEASSATLLLAIGVNEDGFREILGICEGEKDDRAAWSVLLHNLKARGLSGVELFISDASTGLAEALSEIFPNAARQRCLVHWRRDVLGLAPPAKASQVAAMLLTILVEEDPEAARAAARTAVENLKSMELFKAARMIEETLEDTLVFYRFPEEHRRRIRTCDPLEKLMREVRRGTRVGEIARGDSSCLNLASARLRYVEGTAWSTKRFLAVDVVRPLPAKSA